MSAGKIADLLAEVNEATTDAVTAALAGEGVDPLVLLQEGVIRGLERIGEQFEAGEYFLGELILGGEIAEKCIALIDPHLPKGRGAPRGVVVIGAVQGDMHDLGYSLVAKRLELAGFQVHSLGVDVASMSFIDKAREVDADIIGLSTFLVTTIACCSELLDYLRDMGLRDRFKVIVGGGATTQEIADELGTDGWAETAVAAVALCEGLVTPAKQAP
ncbi:MAG: cobalamin-dependent protein [Deltaproteobacteria bacterium]|nr:cobalamin-dependent protein [Deltaproteobacteria bacterium]